MIIYSRLREFLYCDFVTVYMDLNGGKEGMLRRHQDEQERITDRLKAKGASLTNEGYDICINDELRMKFGMVGSDY